jgi:GNAT superfamily N-acetyltransferase
VEDPLDVVVYGDVGAATMAPDLSRLRRIGAGRGVDPAARRKGVGRALQSAAASPAVGRRAWTALAGASPAATSFSLIPQR